MRRLLGYALLLATVAAVTAKTGTARTSSITNKYNSNYAATWTAINNLSGQFNAAQIAFLSGLSNAQCTFLANVEQIGVPENWPLAEDSHSGSTWATGERDVINALIDSYNDLVTKMIRQHLAS